MNLELNYEELSLLLDSTHTRIRQIDKLLVSFDDKELVKLYTKDRIALDKLETKIIKLWNQKNII
jgi:hypothetical protein